jgi:CheY-like chemotaxis protein
LSRVLADAAAALPTRSLVLVVDDSPDMRGLIEDVLADEGYEVVTAASGGRALSVMAERVPDLVITDLFMPGMNGFTLRGEMLRRPEFARIPVVVLSAFWQRPSETLDVAAVLPKPLNVDRLLEVVRRALAPVADSDDTDSENTDASTVPGPNEPTRGRAPQRRRDAGRIQQEA